MARPGGIVTTRVGDVVKVEVWSSDGETTVPNYGNVVPYGSESVAKYRWILASGQSGVTETERGAINATARAIRRHS